MSEISIESASIEDVLFCVQNCWLKQYVSYSIRTILLTLPQQHPVHRTFLLFYQAICYESLGHIAHNYSSNRISLLEQARDAFISASETLPLPYLTKVGGQYDAPGPSPVCPTHDMLGLYDDSPSVYPPTTPGGVMTERGRSVSNASSSTIRSAGHASVAYTVPNFDDYSPRQTINDTTDQEAESNKTFLTPDQRARINHKARLSRSLSTQHALAEELVPSPLFSRGLASKKESQHSSSKVYVNTLPLVTLSKPLPPTPINRPLPALPFNHQPEFILKGKRFLLVPRRKTALATLISKFEGKTPFDSPSPDKENMQSTSAEMTPTTERFKHISAVFSEKEVLNERSNRQNRISPAARNQRRNTTTDTSSVNKEQHITDQASPKTPCPNPSSLTTIHLKTPSSTYTQQLDSNPPAPQPSSSSSSTHLENYNDTLSSLHTSIRHHTTTISTTINTARAIQQAHETEKRQRFADMYSNHRRSSSPCFSSPSASSPRNYSSQSTTPTKAPTQQRKSSHKHDNPTTPNRNDTPNPQLLLHSFWSLPTAEKTALSQRTSHAQISCTQTGTATKPETYTGTGTGTGTRTRLNTTDDPKRQAMLKARIENLRKGAWKTVNKESKGYKGVEYYEELRRAVELEMEMTLPIPIL